MAEPTVWWLIAGAAIVLELLSGTVYLLLLGIGFAAAAISAHLGAGLTTQLVVAAVVGVGAVLTWYMVRHKERAARPPSQANPDVNLDIGGTVLIEAWNPDGTASVRYRGAQWTAMPRPGASPATGMHRVAEVVGSRLVVDKV
ncbi:NfeD family protein [Variovorax sp. OV329]|uniref:NfeD family protein n=1 Tax=Variovorax sp. OV329 TaxID=1882825 RepID=UPI0008E39007|nr:NfeD family protein [Variovorax sp. OV329]SFM67037.1 Membrane protein implicated in regulation of membrane protease activity [Variovorax sp. OV329]